MVANRVLSDQVHGQRSEPGAGGGLVAAEQELLGPCMAAKQQHEMCCMHKAEVGRARRRTRWNRSSGA